MSSGPRQVELTVAVDKAETMAVFLRDKCNLSLIVLEGVAATTFKFLCSSERLTKILQQLEKIGCGVSYGTIVVLPVSILKPSLQQTHTKQSFGVRERLPIEEVYDRVLRMSCMGFNQTMYLLVAASIAALGLIFDSVTTVVSSMLLSPMMDPLVAFIFGSVLRDKKLVLNGLRHFSLCIVSALLIGFIFGLVFAPFSHFLEWPTVEMVNRGTWLGVVSGALVAIPSGIAVGLSVTSGGINSFVGVAIAASLLPPIVNAGIMWGRTSLGGVIPYAPNNSTRRYAIMGAYSMGLFGSNVVMIFIAAYLIFKLKSVVHFHGRSPFYEDLPHIITTPQSLRPWNQDDPDYKNNNSSSHHHHHHHTSSKGPATGGDHTQSPSSRSSTSSVDRAHSSASSSSDTDVGEDEVPEGFLPVVQPTDLRTSPSPNQA